MDSLIPWIGGKKLLRDKIIALFPSEFERYIEVFGGAGWVLFRKDKHANMEVYNDFDGNLVNLFRCTKYHAGELQRELDFTLNSRELFRDYKEQLDMRGLTDIQRAARFFLLVRCSYGADRKTFSCATKPILSAVERLHEVRQRLARVIIESRDFEALICAYDRPSALFFCDPPYKGTEGYYDGFSGDDHNRLKEVLNGIKGRFILTYNDCKFIRDLYNGFNIHEVSRSNNLIARYNGGKYKELIITNG
ncbi:DNA adenine methylase [Eubacteriales bacterium OttesenSCG-928-K08]|nr:DNA adenine methylase [Eubacteriales bacterium OttesenSCG-928-K08]